MNNLEINRAIAEIDPYRFASEINIVRKNMEDYGGSFERGLANALLHADMENCLKIKTTWSDLWEKWLNWKRKGE